MIKLKEYKDMTKKPYIYENNGNIKEIYDITNNKFQIGEIVKVVNDGQFYSTYKEMAIAMDISSKDWLQYDLYNGDIGSIVNVKIHESDSDIVYGVKINNSNKVALIGEDGLESMLLSILPDELFEI